MKNLKMYTFFMLSILALLVLLLSGCDNPSEYDEQPPVAVAIVLGNHANAYGLNLSSPDLIALISEATSNGFVSVICCDGQPYIVSADLYQIPVQYRQADPMKLQADARQRATNILAGLTQVKAEHPELDTLAALRQAVRSFASAPEDSQKTIYVFDSGLSTSGQMDFRNNLLDADPAVIADLLIERKIIPDFTGINVKWLQLGDVAAPQKPLSYAEVQKLGAIWEAIIEKRGGSIEISNAPPSQIMNDPSQYPPVSIVDLPLETPIIFEQVESTEIVETFDPTKNSIFSGQQIHFVKDSAEYLDQKKAATILRPVADYMIQNPEFKGLLVGTTATGNLDFCLRLSKDRVKAVRDTLVLMGVESEQLQLCGLGFNNPWHISDTDPDGGLIEELAFKNRKVILLPTDSPEALTIIAIDDQASCL